MIKRAVSEMVTNPWTRKGTEEQAAVCLEAQELVTPLRLRDPSHYNASRVAWNASKVRSIMLFELCEPDRSLDCVRETQAIIKAFQPTDVDVGGKSDRQAQLSQIMLVRCAYEEAYGRWGDWLQSARDVIRMLEEYMALSHAPRASDRVQYHEARVYERFLTFFDSATAEELATLGDAPLRPELAKLLDEAEEQAELAFATLAEQPRRELFISKASNSAHTLARWHYRLFQEEEAREWLVRARDATVAPGPNRTSAVLADIAIFESAATEELPVIHEDQIGDDVAAKLYVKSARAAIKRKDSVEAARLASRASLLFDRNERACDVHVALRENRAMIEKILGQADLAEAARHTGPKQLEYLERAQGRFEGSLELWEGTTGDALYKKAHAYEGAEVERLLGLCRAKLEEQQDK